MQDNQQNQYNQLNQQLLDQPSKPGIQPQVNTQMNIQQGYPPQVNAQMNFQGYPPQVNAQMNVQGYPPQVNAQMNFPQGYQIPPNFPQNINIPPNFPQNYPQNNPNIHPNLQNIPKPEELFEMQKRMMAGERVNIFNPNQQQSNAYVLPPQVQPVGDKLIIPFSNCKNIVMEVFMIITSIMVVCSAPSIGKIYTAIFL